MSLSIRKVPDPILRVVCTSVDGFGPALAALTNSMLAAMYLAKGRGLAAPQVGVAKRLFVMDSTWKDGDPSPMTFVNPVITWSDKRRSSQEEGCLSIPGSACLVTRPVAIELQWQDLDGQLHKDTFDGFAARCIQHERDHLDGTLCTDYAS